MKAQEGTWRAEDKSGKKVRVKSKREKRIEEKGGGGKEESTAKRKKSQTEGEKRKIKDEGEKKLGWLKERSEGEESRRRRG